MRREARLLKCDDCGRNISVGFERIEGLVCVTCGGCEILHAIIFTYDDEWFWWPTFKKIHKKFCYLFVPLLLMGGLLTFEVEVVLLLAAAAVPLLALLAFVGMHVYVPTAVTRHLPYRLAFNGEKWNLEDSFGLNTEVAIRNASIGEMSDYNFVQGICWKTQVAVVLDTREVNDRTFVLHRVVIGCRNAKEANTILAWIESNRGDVDAIG